MDSLPDLRSVRRALDKKRIGGWQVKGRRAVASSVARADLCEKVRIGGATDGRLITNQKVGRTFREIEVDDGPGWNSRWQLLRNRLGHQERRHQHVVERAGDGLLFGCDRTGCQLVEGDHRICDLVSCHCTSRNLSGFNRGRGKLDRSHSRVFDLGGLDGGVGQLGRRDDGVCHHGRGDGLVLDPRQRLQSR